MVIHLDNTTVHRSDTSGLLQEVRCNHSCHSYLPEAKLPTHHLGVELRPAVVTHRAPVPRVVHLQTPLPGAVPAHQPHHAI